MRTDRKISWVAAIAVVMGCGPAPDISSPGVAAPPTAVSLDRDDNNGHGGHAKDATTLYVWASDQAGVAPDFLAVIDFDRKSSNYGKVLRTVPSRRRATPATSRITVTRPPTRRFLAAAGS